MAVGNVVARYPRAGARWYAGELIGAGAAPFTGVKFKGEATFTRTGVGLATFQCLENGVGLRPGSPCRITAFTATPINLTNTAQGGWFTNILVDSLNTNGSFTVQFNALAGTAADIGAAITVKFALLIEKENA